MTTGPGRVLIADSDRDFRLKLYKRLIDLDVFSDTAGDGREAIDRLSSEDYAVLVVDLTLPHAGAERILEAVIDEPRERRPVVLVIAPPGSARTLDVEVVQIVLRRPCDIRQLADIIRNCAHIASTAQQPRGEAFATDQPAA